MLNFGFGCISYLNDIILCQICEKTFVPFVSLNDTFIYHPYYSNSNSTCVCRGLWECVCPMYRAET